MEIGKYVKCVRGFAYKITNDKGYYKVEEVAEDGTAQVEIIWHENRDYIGRHEKIRLDDFEEVSEDEIFIKFDEELSRRYLGFSGFSFNYELSRIQSKIYRSASNMYVDASNFGSSYLKHLFVMMCIPNEDDVELPQPRVYIGEVNGSSSTIASVNDYVVRRIRDDDFEKKIITVTRNFDDMENDVKCFVEEYGWAEILEFPEGFLMPYKVKKVAVRVLQKDDTYLMLTSEKSYLHMMGFAVLVAKLEGHPLSDEAIQALLKEDGNEYFKAVTAGVDEWFARTAEDRKKKQFEDFAKQFLGMRANSINRDLESIQNNIDDLQSRLRDYFRRKQDVLEKQFYITHGLGAQDEFIDMLRGMDRVPVMKVDERHNSIDFCVITPLTYWDDDLWDIVRKSDYNFGGLSAPKKVLLDKIFKDREIKLLFEQKFKFRADEAVAYQNTDQYSVDNGEGLVGIPNPHMHFYNCWGSHAPLIEEALSKSDYMTAYAQAVACISGVTLDDSVVFEKFLRNHLFEHRYENQPCLEMPDGTRTTIKKWLEENKDAKWEE